MPGGIMTGGIFTQPHIVVALEVPRLMTFGLARKLTRIDNNLIQAGFSANDMGLMLDLLYKTAGTCTDRTASPGRGAGHPGGAAGRHHASGISETPTDPHRQFEGGNSHGYRWTHIGGYLNTLDLEWGVTVLRRKPETACPPGDATTTNRAWRSWRRCP